MDGRLPPSTAEGQEEQGRENIDRRRGQEAAAEEVGSGRGRRATGETRRQANQPEPWCNDVPSGKRGANPESECWVAVGTLPLAVRQRRHALSGGCQGSEGCDGRTVSLCSGRSNGGGGGKGDAAIPLVYDAPFRASRETVAERAPGSWGIR